MGGILAAPYTGQKSREMLGNKAGEGLNYLKEKTGELRETAAGAVGKSKEAVGQQIENIAINTNAKPVYQR